MSTAAEIAMQVAQSNHMLDALRYQFNREIDRMTMEAMQGQTGSARIIHELPPFPPLPPDASPEDRAARDRQERFEKIGVTASPDTMSEDTYLRDFAGRTWFVSPIVKDQFERVRHVHHCPKCEAVDKPTGRIVASRFFVTFEDDVMQQFPAVAHSTCHHCGFEEYYPMRSDPRRRDRDAKERELQELIHVERMRQREAHESYLKGLRHNAGPLAPEQTPIARSLVSSEAQPSPAVINDIVNAAAAAGPEQGNKIVEAMRKKGWI